MPKRTINPKAVELTNEIGRLATRYIQTERAKRRIFAYTFCKEIGFDTHIYSRIANGKRTAININTACIILDKIGYELKIVKKEEKS